MQEQTTTGFNLYQMVTDRIIDLLEKGTVPWRKPWSSGGPPMNALTRRLYSGINHWLLLSLNYSSSLFLTFEQVRKLGGSVRKDEKGHQAVFWAMLTPQELEEKSEAETAEKRIPYLRYYTLFNVEQCTHLPPRLLESSFERQVYPIAACEGIVQAMPQSPPIRFDQNKAFYHPQQDYVNMPAMKRFKNGESYYSTLFHELVHSTGHVSRLHRKSLTEMAEFGSPTYSFEELVAELGSCYLCAHAGISQKEIRNSAAYIKGWMGRLREDPKCILTASAQAQKAVDFILKREREVSLLGQPEKERA